MNSEHHVLDLVQVAFWIGLILAVLKVWKSVGKPVKDRVVKFDALCKEFYPNGGSSMKDSLTGIKADIASGHDKLDQVVGTVDIVRKDVAVLKVMKAIESDGVVEARVQFNDKLELTMANQSALKILGCSFDEARGHGWKSKLRPEYAEAITKEMERAAEERRRTSRDVIVQRSPTDGISVMVHLIPFVCERQEFLGFYGNLGTVVAEPSSI